MTEQCLGAIPAQYYDIVDDVVRLRCMSGRPNYIFPNCGSVYIVCTHYTMWPICCYDSPHNDKSAGVSCSVYPALVWASVHVLSVGRGRSKPSPETSSGSNPPRLILLSLNLLCQGRVGTPDTHKMVGRFRHKWPVWLILRCVWTPFPCRISVLKISAAEEEAEWIIH